ncbi:hypothetical protein B0H11DRAFT_1981449 [Mycena galericulata]|nr:hypothetical protein B0H11DRAFT_1981449 [Mycena galericulata]
MLELAPSKSTPARRRRRRIFSHFMSCHSFNAAMFDIDGDVVIETVAEREARESRTQYNELAPIARLPPEVLADIFVRCVPVSIRKLHNDLSWLNVIRVTSRWRSVALACPDFWSTLVFSRPKWTPVMLARSKQSSLVIRVDLRKEQDNSPEPILLDNTARLGTLDLRSSQHYLTTFVSNLEHADAAPRLTCIKIVNSDTDNLGEGGMWLPPDLFRRTEVLKSRKFPAQAGVRLHLDACAFPWDSTWYSNLIHLHLENINPAQRPTMEAFLGVLIGSPALQTLTIINCSPTTHEGFPIHLPRLTALTLKSDSSSTCAPLLGYLIIPPSAMLSVCCSNETKHAMYQILIPKFSDVAHSAYDTVRIIHKDEIVTYSLLNSAKTEWSRKLLIARPAHSILGVTEAVVQHLNFSNVTTLVMQGLQGLDDDALSLWDTMGRNMRAVHTLHLHRSFPAALLEFLLTQAMLLLGVSHFRSCFNRPQSIRAPLEPVAFRGPDGALTHAWPALTCISLHGVDLNDVPAQLTLQPTPADLLRSLLWARRAGRVPILQLEIEDCEKVFSTDLAHFRLFSDVVYDGKGQMNVHKDEDGDDSLSSYSINVFANMIEHSRTSTRE